MDNVAEFTHTDCQARLRGGSQMAVRRKADLNAPFADKKRIQELVAEQNLLMGFVKDPTATPQKAREMMRQLGIRPEDNEFSREIIAGRDAK
jgi:hypothetical protein